MHEILCLDQEDDLPSKKRRIIDNNEKDNDDTDIQAKIQHLNAQQMEHAKLMNEIGDLDACGLCGCIMGSDVERRYKQLQYIASLVACKCTATHFVHGALIARADEERRTHAWQHYFGQCDKKGHKHLRASSSAELQQQHCCDCHRFFDERQLKSGPIFDALYGVGNDSTKKPMIPLSPVRPLDRSLDFDENGHFLGCTAGRRMPFCIACINWIRRLGKKLARVNITNSATKKKEPVAVEQRTSNHANERGIPQHISTIIPLDSLLIFLNHPGCKREPDKRAIGRLLQNLCTQYSAHSVMNMNMNICIQNAYLGIACSGGPVVENVLHMFRSRYAAFYDFDASAKKQWKSMRAVNAQRIEKGNVSGSIVSVAKKTVKSDSNDNDDEAQKQPTFLIKSKNGVAPCFVQRCMAARNARLINDIIAVWWEFHGMPTVIACRHAARAVRKMLRDRNTAAAAAVAVVCDA